MKSDAHTLSVRVRPPKCLTVRSADDRLSVASTPHPILPIADVRHPLTGRISARQNLLFLIESGFERLAGIDPAVGNARVTGVTFSPVTNSVSIPRKIRTWLARFVDRRHTSPLRRFATNLDAPLAQLDRASVYGTEG